MKAILSTIAAVTLMTSISMAGASGVHCDKWDKLSFSDINDEIRDRGNTIARSYGKIDSMSFTTDRYVDSSDNVRYNVVACFITRKSAN